MDPVIIYGLGQAVRFNQRVKGRPMRKSKILAVMLCLSMLATVLITISATIKSDGDQGLSTESPVDTTMDRATTQKDGSAAIVPNGTPVTGPHDSIGIGDGTIPQETDLVTTYPKGSASSQIKDCDGPSDLPIQAKKEVIISTDLFDRTVLAGYPVTDTATVTSASGPIPTGTVSFEYSYEGGPWNEYDIGTLYDNGQVETNYFYAFGGHFEFRAIYSGDSNYLSATSPEGSEPLDAIRNPSFTDISLFEGSRIALGESVNVSVIIPPTGRFPPTYGSITFQVSYKGRPFETFATGELGGVSVVSYTPSEAGHYEFQAVYSGDRDYLGSTSPAGYCPLDVDTAISETRTCLGVQTITLGESVTDNVSVTGLCGKSQLPSGTVDFEVRFNGGDWMGYDAGVVLVDGSAKSEAFTPTAVGDYYFRAIYSGDGIYLGSISNPSGEPLHVEIDKDMNCT
jgi:hypothetical protein